jgi:hypothetical protein
MSSDSNLDKVGFERSIGFGSPESKFISKTATESSTIIIEKRDEKDEVVDCSPVKSIVYTKSTSQINTSNSQEPTTTTITTFTASVSSQVKPPSQEPTKKNNLDYSSVTFNSVGPSKVPTAASTPSASLAKLPVTRQLSLTMASTSATRPLQQLGTTAASPLSSKVSKAGSTRTATSTTTTTTTTTSMNLSAKLTNASSNLEERAKDNQPPVSERSKFIPTTPSRHGPDHGLYSASQNLLAPLKIDRNFLTKIVSSCQNFFLYFSDLNIEICFLCAM